MSDDHKPTYIKEQHNTNCQQFFGPITNCTFTMPSASPRTQSKVGSVRTVSKSQTPRVTSCTYRYRWMDKAEVRIATLYQYIVKAGFISKDTHPDDFMAIFSGGESTARIKWLAPQAWLWYMLREMENRQYIAVDNGVGIWMVASNHFVSRDGRLFRNTSFKGLKTPQKAVKALDRLVEILNVKTSMPTPDIMDDDLDSEPWAYIKDKGWEINEMD